MFKPDLQGRGSRMRNGMDGNEPMTLTVTGRVQALSRDRVRNLERDGLRGLSKLSDNVENCCLYYSIRGIDIG